MRPGPPARPDRRRRWRSGGAVLVVALCVTGAAAATTIRAPHADWQAEAEAVGLINAARAAAGLPGLASDPAAAALARDWAMRLAATGVLAHQPDLGGTVGRRVTPGWTAVGENVGAGPSVAWLHGAFMTSGPHRDNVLGDFNRVGVGVVVRDGTAWIATVFLRAAPFLGRQGLALGPAPVDDLWLVLRSGDVLAFGSRTALPPPAWSATPPTSTAAGVVGIAAPPARTGYWLATAGGAVLPFGDAPFLGSVADLPLVRPIVGVASTATGGGYWLVAADGGVFAFGDAPYHGSTGGMPLVSPVVGIAPTPAGDGYWLVAADGGIFAFGDAPFHGSTGGVPLVAGVVGMAPTATGSGYRLVAADGGVFAFGDAPFLGSAAGAFPAPAVAVAATGDGYRVVDAEGRVLPFGVPGALSSGALATTAPVVAAVA